ncbi:TetR/AcrR family transcriptional regulator [Cellulomonas sp. CW35]|uniref:TetR/AcrR family transcriptional regulator n=1 Tax=Cellulomonas sp. CW35 TaxID=3458249 RepID=UPI0040336D9A
MARRHLLDQGYQGLRMRAVAAEAGVDAALVSYYFGSKKGLFGAALALTANPPEALRAAIAGDLATLPERVLRTLVTAWDDPVQGEPLRLMINAAAHEPDLVRLLREVVQTEMVHQLAERFGGLDATARAAAFGAQLAGLILVRYLLVVEPVASMPVEDLVRFAAPGLHAAMQGPTGRPRSIAAVDGPRGTVANSPRPRRAH